MALAVAAGFTACSDDDNYLEGQQSPGAFFEKSNPESVEVNLEATTFALKVGRTSADAAATYNITVEGTDAALFNVPPTVAFEEGELTTAFTVSYDPTKLQQDKIYNISFVLENATVYGTARMDIKFKRRVPLTTKPVPPVGTGTVYYGAMLAGEVVEGHDIDMTYNSEDPNHNVLFTIHNFCALALAEYNGIDLSVTAADMTPDANGNIAVDVPGVFTKVTSSGSPIGVADLRWFFINVMNDATEGKKYGVDCMPSYYNPKDGTFYLNLIFYNMESAGSYWGSMNDYTVFQLDGFPNYGVTADFGGFNITPNEDVFALINIQAGKDVAKLGMLVEKDGDAAKLEAAIKAGAEGVIEVEPAEEVTAKAPLNGKGNYVGVIVSFDASGVARETAIVKFAFNLGGDDDKANWQSIGMAEFTDGWIVPAYSSQGVQLVADEWKYPVPAYKHKDEVGLYMLEKPYGDASPLTQAGLNGCESPKANLQFILAANSIFVAPQQSDYVLSSRGNMVIGNFEGYVYTQNEGATYQQVVSYVKGKLGDEASFVEDGICVIPVPMFEGPQGFGYNWTDYQSAVIVIDEDEAKQAQSKRKAKAIAAPVRAGVRAEMAVKRVRAIDVAMPRRLR